MLDRARLSPEEREELRRALTSYRYDVLDKGVRSRNVVTRADARWRLFVVRSLLNELAG